MTVRTGDTVDGYELVGQAPVDYSGRGAREVNGHAVAGFWRDPWWGFNGHAWGLVRWWRSKPNFTWDQETRENRETVPALNEAVVTPWPERENR